MSEGQITEQELRRELDRKHADANAAKRALGMGLLKGGADVPKLRGIYAKSLQAVTDAEAMLDALADYTAEITAVRLSARHTTMAPRVSRQEYADALKRFQRDYSALRKKHGAVLARGKELVALAKRCGQMALSDVRTRFKSLPASPELHSL